MTQTEDTGFVKRGLLLLTGMTCLGLVVLGIVLYRPERPMPELPKDLPADPSSPGWQIRYNAAIALARRGSEHVPWKVVAEMLDEKQQFRNFSSVVADGREIPNEVNARRTILQTLEAVRDWHRKHAEHKEKPSPELETVYARVDRLAQSPIVELRAQAEATRQMFFR